MRQRRVIAIALAAALGVAAVASPAGLWLIQFVEWARSAGPLGVLAFAAAYLLCALFLVPGWPLRVGAGLVYGPVWGFAVAAPMTFVAATIAFLLGRRLFRERIARRIAREPRLAAVDAAVAENGLWVVLLLRLSPFFPNELVNYGLGATRVRLRDYAIASFVGLVPLTASYTWLGSLLTRMSDLEHGRPGVSGVPGQALWWVGLAATLAAAVVLTRLAGRALDRSLQPALAAPALTSGNEAAPTLASMG